MNPTTRAARLRVLTSYREPKETTNPYITMLTESLKESEALTVSTFGYRRGFFSRYDVFHVHWPEVLMSGHRGLGRCMRQGLTGLLLLRLTLTRTPVVRTVHNVERPSGLMVTEKWLLSWMDRLTVLRICLNEQTMELVTGASVVIPHGDYRAWYAPYQPQPVVTGRVQFFGLVRRYKGIDDLIRAFSGLTLPGVRLHIAGKPTSAELAGELSRLAAEDERIDVRWGFLSDQQVSDVVSSSEIIVLPYQFMHNSAATLTALSLNRPVLVPDNKVNRALSDEVGPGWVFTFVDRLKHEDIEDALTRLRREPPSAPPDLSRREWTRAITGHIQAYQRAVGTHVGDPSPEDRISETV